MANKNIRKRCFLRGVIGMVLVGSAMTPVLADSTGHAASPPLASNVWAVMAGSSLKGTLERWSEVAGWTLVWDNRSDFQLRASATFRGGFEEAVGTLVDGIYLTNSGFTATLYRGNKVLHVQEQTLSSN